MSPARLRLPLVLLVACQAPPDARVQAEGLYSARCAGCHASSGAGDPRTGVRMPDFRDAAWQARTTDDAIEAIVARGGAAVGKHPMMPANPDLATSRELLAAMRRRIRAFAP